MDRQKKSHLATSSRQHICSKEWNECVDWISLKSNVCVVSDWKQLGNNTSFQRPPKSHNTEIQVNLLCSLNTLQQGSLYNQPKHCTMRGISLKITIDFRFHNPCPSRPSFLLAKSVSGHIFGPKFSHVLASRLGVERSHGSFSTSWVPDLSTGSLQRYQPGGWAFLLHLSHGHQPKTRIEAWCSDDGQFTTAETQ